MSSPKSETLERILSAARRLLEALVAFIDDHFTTVYGVAKALLRMRDGDEAAAVAINDRVNAIREECRTAIETLHRDGTLILEWTVENATAVATPIRA